LTEVNFGNTYKEDFYLLIEMLIEKIIIFYDRRVQLLNNKILEISNYFLVIIKLSILKYYTFISFCNQ